LELNKEKEIFNNENFQSVGMLSWAAEKAGLKEITALCDMIFCIVVSRFPPEEGKQLFLRTAGI